MKNREQKQTAQKKGSFVERHPNFFEALRYFDEWNYCQH